MLNAAPGLKCRSPDGAFYTYPSCAGALGRKTPDGKLARFKRVSDSWIPGLSKRFVNEKRDALEMLKAETLFLSNPPLERRR